MIISPSKSLTIDDIRPYLVNAKNKGEQIVAACPLCEAGDKSGHHLYIKNTREALLVYCQKCEAPGGDIIKEFIRLGAKHEEAIPTSVVIERRKHEYKNTDGTTAYFKVGEKYSDGHKNFSFMYYDGQGRKNYRLPENANTLYNLDLLQNADENTTLYIVEGEKCADRMTENGLLATTSNTGARSHIKFTNTDLALLNKFKNKIVIPDNDEKGLEYAKAFENADILYMTDFWTDCPLKGDVADYLDNDLPIDNIVNFKPYKLTEEAIKEMGAPEILNANFLKGVFKVQSPLERQRILSLLELRAGELKCRNVFKNYLKAYIKESGVKHYKGNVQQFSDNPPIANLNCGDWVADMDGVRRFVKNVEGEVDEEIASSIPITPSAILKNIENATEKIALSYYTDEMWHTINVQRSTVANHSKVVELADLGVDVTSGSAKTLVKYIADVVNSNDKAKLPRVNTVSHLGWVDNDFVPYASNVKTDVGIEFMDTVNSVNESGDLEEWVDFVRPLRENIYLRVALAASFSSPLISRVNMLPYVLMMYGGTGVGKTVALQVASSIWGDPETGKLVKSLNNTINYTMQILGTLKHLPFFGDELQTIREKFGGYDELLYRITEGVDRGRMTNSIVQKINSWSSCSILSGEEDCVKGFSGGGVANRVISIECKEKVIEDGHKVSSFVKHHYGCAGRAYIESLKNYDLLAEYKQIREELARNVDSTEKQTMAMALIVLGDKISSENIFHDSPMSLESVIGFLKSSQDVDIAERAYSWVCDFISEHIAKFEGDSNVIWGKRAAIGEVAINKSVLEREMLNAGFDFNAVKVRWAERKYLVKNSQGRYHNRLSINGQHTTCIILKC